MSESVPASEAARKMLRAEPDRTAETAATVHDDPNTLTHALTGSDARSAPLSRARLLSLQRTVGNSATQRMIASHVRRSTIQRDPEDERDKTNKGSGQTPASDPAPPNSSPGIIGPPPPPPTPTLSSPGATPQLSSQPPAPTQSSSTPAAGLSDPRGASRVAPDNSPQLTPAPPKPKAPTPDNASSGVNWDEVFSRLNIARGVTELGRLVPVVGLASGVVADGLQTYADYDAVSDEEAPYFKTFMALRNLLNLANNGINHVLYVDQLVQDGLIGSVAFAPFATLTATVNEIGKGGKWAIDAVQSFVDMIGIAWAQERAMNAPPDSPSAKHWQSMQQNYVANTLGDWLNLALDTIDIASGGATQGSAIQTGAKIARESVPVIKLVKPLIISVLQSWWNIYGSNVLPSGSAAPAAAQRSTAGVQRSVAQRVTAPNAARAALFETILVELTQIRGGYQLGDTVLEGLITTFTKQQEVALASASKLMGGKDPFVMLRNATATMLSKMSERVDTLSKTQALATSADQKATEIATFCEGLLGKIDALVVPHIDLAPPKVDGDNAIAGAANTLLSVGSGIANSGANLLVDQIRTAVDKVKSEFGGVVRDVQSHAQDIGGFMQILTHAAADQITFVSKWITEVSAKLAKCTNPTQVMELAIQQMLRFAGVESDFKLEDLHKDWKSIGPMIDQAEVWAKSQRDAALAGRQADPMPGPVPAQPPPPPTPSTGGTPPTGTPSAARSA